MESHIVAQLAARMRLPFAVLRVIADPAERAIPPAALVGMRRRWRDRRSGGARLARESARVSCRRSYASRPIRERAMAALFRCHNLLGSGLGFGDLG